MFVDPELASVDAGFSLLVIMLIGGWGTQFGPLLGSVVYIFLPAAFSLLQEYSLFIWAIVLLLILRIAPKGLTGLGERLPLATRPLQTTMQESLTVKAIETTENDKSQPIALEIRNVTKRFGGLIALNNVNLRIAGGQIHGLIGPNGAGKTTLLNVISGFAYPDQGEVNFNGKRIDGLPPHRIAQMGVSRTFQGTILCEGMLSIDEVRLGQHTRTKSGVISSAFSTRFARVEEMVSRKSAIDLMHFFEVSDKALVDVESLPYNCRKFSELARAMASRPLILLLDEPTSGLAMKESESLMEKLRQLRGTGLGILFIDHNVKAVMSVADTITVLNFGSKIAEGTPEAIQNDEGVVTAYLGRKGK
jgi:branched-chain amino acid transport system permease protein